MTNLPLTIIIFPTTTSVYCWRLLRLVLRFRFRTISFQKFSFCMNLLAVMMPSIPGRKLPQPFAPTSCQFFLHLGRRLIEVIAGVEVTVVFIASECSILFVELVALSLVKVDEE